MVVSDVTSYDRGVPWNVDGVGPEDRFVALHYNAPAGALIAQFERNVSGSYPVASIYVKRANDPQYWSAFAADDKTSATDLATAGQAPFVLFRVMVTRGTVDSRQGVGFDWSHIGRIDLLTKEVSVALDAKLFRERHGGAWIAGILAAADDGRSLLCRIAKSEPSEESPLRKLSRYSLCRLDLSTGDFEVLAALPNIFF